MLVVSIQKLVQTVKTMAKTFMSAGDDACVDVCHDVHDDVYNDLYRGQNGQSRDFTLQFMVWQGYH